MPHDKEHNLKTLSRHAVSHEPSPLIFNMSRQPKTIRHLKKVINIRMERERQHHIQTMQGDLKITNIHKIEHNVILSIKSKRTIISKRTVRSKRTEE